MHWCLNEKLPASVHCILSYFKECRVACLATSDQLEVVCRVEAVKCRELGVNKSNLCEYEVEYLCNYRRKVITGGKTDVTQVRVTDNKLLVSLYSVSETAEGLD